ncbi:restriction endonuclease subunit S [Bacillus atrophaeus]|uniref:restriction endonuclease subunit S n=1 Tax=Bacillus atrophaeus TaxID=1452 RepID=UPI00228060D3|nr:restriction endonuclease subunit S [Bacillus atrophaeus]MCY9107187.1 restriction endonuclease subunit S [Bacillus atrophaeus]MEC1899721.1 restriction endonuclease subunit S [Bacillus atrophaeus]MEC2395580.1 restriction endonuclease subunit S [Bacillus atrophaeus]MED4435209.1 restriction endonuclease subunit S [Bacillus atrophaeus]MED4564962.1 restriction endonuclease subunit S [Bacillus atrophaeus]
MSKKKKTIEELLEEALVSEDGQPFQVPENWVWTKLGFIGEIGSSKRVLKSDWKSAGIPFYRAREIVSLNKNEKIKNGIFISEELYTELALKYGIPKEEDLLITAVGTIGQPYIVKKEDRFYFKDASVIWFKNNTKQCINFINLFFKSRYAQNQIKGMSAGTTVDTYTISNAKQTLIPLPPLNEQKRIADKVERLLSKIEEAKQLIEEAKETFELRQAAIIRTILKEELSNGKLPTGWRNIKVKELFTIFGGGTPSKAKEEYWNGRIPWISAKDMKTTFISETMDYITEEGLNNSSAKLAKRGSVAMVVRSGILQRTLPVAFLLSECTVNQDLKVFDSGDELINKYFLWYVKGNEKNLLHNYSKSGTTVNSIEFEKFKSHEILLPPMDVLKQKIDKIENVIEKEKSANVMLNLANSIDELKSSILSKAFRGELGTNDPSEENAIDLLKKVLQEQVK